MLFIMLKYGYWDYCLLYSSSIWRSGALYWGIWAFERPNEQNRFLFLAGFFARLDFVSIFDLNLCFIRLTGHVSGKCGKRGHRPIGLTSENYWCEERKIINLLIS